MTGFDQFDWSVTRAGVGLSMCETVTVLAESMRPGWIGVLVRLLASVDRYSREPFAQENLPFLSTGPKATEEPPAARRPFS